MSVILKLEAEKENVFESEDLALMVFVGPLEEMAESV